MRRPARPCASATASAAVAAISTTDGRPTQPTQAARRGEQFGVAEAEPLAPANSLIDPAHGDEHRETGDGADQMGDRQGRRNEIGGRDAGRDQG